jgi:hypothetical protein
MTMAGNLVIAHGGWLFGSGSHLGYHSVTGDGYLG